VEAKFDTSLFIYHHGAETVYLLFYVDDIVLTASSESLLRRLIASLQQEFAMKDLGALDHFLGVTVEPHPARLLLHQRQYTLDILKRVGMTDYKPAPLRLTHKASYRRLRVPQLQIPLYIGVLPVHFSTSPSPDLTSPMHFSRYVSICMIFVSHTSPLSSGSYATSAAASTSVSSTGGRPPPSSSSTLTPTGPGVRTPAAPPPATPSS